MTVKNAFDPRGRERFVPKMNQVEYVEMRAFQGHETRYGYFCFSCPYMKFSVKSSTGYWCEKFGFEDQPSGCCDGWEPFPEVQKVQDAYVQSRLI